MRKFFFVRLTGSPGFSPSCYEGFLYCNNNRRRAGEGACGWWSPSGLVYAVAFVSWLKKNFTRVLRQSEDWCKSGPSENT